jgi:hypothetical protein
MKWVLNILGVPLFLMGIVWILQGTGLYPMGFMAHQIKYTYAGIRGGSHRDRVNCNCQPAQEEPSALD